MSSTAFITPDFRDERLAQTNDWQMLVGGKDLATASGEMIYREAPGHRGALIARYQQGSAEDVDAAVRAARTAFDEGPWPSMPGAERARLMARVAALLDKHREELALLEALEVGKPIAQARAEVGGCIDLWEYGASQVRGLHGEAHSNLAPDVLGMVLREPVGVVGVITPWNFPLIIACERMPWILGAGATMIIKPSEFTSGATIRLAELIREAGVPDGVVNVVTGFGDPVGEAMARHPGIDMMSFTGSARVGRMVGAAAASTVKRVGLELGGKGPQVVFADADLEAAADGVAFGVLFNNGQCCVSGSRLVIDRSIKDQFLDRLIDKMSRVTYGDPLNERTQVGAVVNSAHMERISSYVAQGHEEGARLLLGGHRAGEENGLYFEPTVFDEVHPDMRIAREEIFGPVLTVLSFDTPEQAVRIANATEYGLSASVWTRDLARGLGTVGKIRAGKVWINSVIGSYPELPLGGYKQSGVGRETGQYGFDEYSQFKTVIASYRSRQMWIGGTNALPPDLAEA